MPEGSGELCVTENLERERTYHLRAETMEEKNELAHEGKEIFKKKMTGSRTFKQREKVKVKSKMRKIQSIGLELNMHKGKG